MKNSVGENQVGLKRLIISVAFCLSFFTSAVSAQMDGTEAFQIEQRCIPEPTQPPDDWTYPGMILMSSYAGIHAMQADWETPHVVAQFTMDAQGNEPIDGGQLSPDGNWYAAPMGEFEVSASNNQFWFVRALKLFSLSGDSQNIWLDLSNYGDNLNAISASIFAPLIWRGSQTLLIGSLVIDPFDQAIDESEFFTFSLNFQPKVFAPDGMRLYGTYDTSFNTGVFDLMSMSLTKALDDLIQVSWRRDLAGFMGQTVREQDWHGLTYFNREGQLIDRILPFDASPYHNELPVSGRPEQWWSPDNRYFAFVVDPTGVPRELYMVDMQERLVIDTCLSAMNAPVWSPDGSMFAYLAEASENLSLVIIDITTWQAYIVARHSGFPARLSYFPEMVGWRSTTNDQ